MDNTSLACRTMSLEELLVADPLGAVDARLEALFLAQFNESKAVVYEDPEVALAYTTVRAIIAAKQRDGTTHFTGKDFETYDGCRNVAKQLEVNVSAVLNYHKAVEIRLNVMRESDTNRQMFDLIDAQKHAWNELKQDAPIITLTAKDFPLTLGINDQPLLVFFSGEYCMPCHVRKPAFALLAKFFTGAKLGFCSELPDATKLSVGFVPQLILFTRAGGKFHSYLPNTTKELWELMHRVVLLGDNTVEELMFDMEDGISVVPYKC